MKLNRLIKGLSTAGRFLATTLFCLSSIAFVWQGALISNTSAMAASSALIASTDGANQVKQKTNQTAAQSKNFIDDVKDKVKEAANSNANKIDKATDNGSFFERKANRDRDRIEKRADEDAVRTKKAVDNSKNAVKGAVDNIKDAFSN